MNLSRWALWKKSAGGRTPEQLRNHYVVEKELADRLRGATREERSEIYRTMYDILFSKVPDHPRLTRREDPDASSRANHRKLKLVERFVRGDATCVEFGPGDCTFSQEMAKRAGRVIGIDLSDQAGRLVTVPNFQLVVYDGYQLDLPDGTADLVFSDQLLEHLHPDDVGLHFALVRRLLKPEGVYVCRTPHQFSGPHDVSGYFCEEAEGFHLKEWTYREIGSAMAEQGLSWRGYWVARSLSIPIPKACLYGAEAMLDALPRGLRKRLSCFVFPSVTVAAYKTNREDLTRLPSKANDTPASQQGDRREQENVSTAQYTP